MERNLKVIRHRIKNANARNLLVAEQIIEDGTTGKVRKRRTTKKIKKLRLERELRRGECPVLEAKYRAMGEL